MIDKDKLNLSVKAPTPKEKPKIDTLRQSAIFIEQTLLNKPIEESAHAEKYFKINANLIERGKEAIKKVGITLTTPQHKAINVALTLLNRQSQTVNPKKNDYYTGDAGDVTPDKYGRRYATLSFSLYEATQMFYNERKVNTVKMDYLESIYDELANTPNAMEYTVQTKNQQGQKINHDISEVASLLTRIESVNQTTRIRTLSYEFNKIITANIVSKYITKPIDANKRIEDAYNSERPHELAHNLSNYLLLLISTKNPILKREIYWSNLLLKIAPNHRKDEKGNFIREDKLKKNVIRALNGLKNDGQIKEFKEIDGATGEKKLQIELIKDWIK